MISGYYNNVMADFVWAEQLGIIIIINKITLLLDLQTIENYVKNVDYINFNDIKLKCLISLNLNPIWKW